MPPLCLGVGGEAIADCRHPPASWNRFGLQLTCAPQGWHMTTLGLFGSFAHSHFQSDFAPLPLGGQAVSAPIFFMDSRLLLGAHVVANVSF